ncbi:MULTISPECIES: hypothetical protein [unclassified Rhodosalinus]|uniref:hypothetical protein n=1 Tax=unclassified Rhodosalinus TaxID=2630183 RepID=UPI00352594A9
MPRRSAILALLGLVAACGTTADLAEPPVPLGDFRLGHSVVLAREPVIGPASREATRQEWEAALDAAIEERFGRYEGDSFYHFGVSVDGYVLALPGVPILFSPNSALIVSVTVWDDATGTKLNEEPFRVTVTESPTGESLLLGSGLSNSKQEQLRNLSVSAAKQLERELVRRHREEGWFGGPEPSDAAPGTTSGAAAQVADG